MMLRGAEINHTIVSCSAGVHAVEFINVIIIAGILVHCVGAHDEISIETEERRKAKSKNKVFKNNSISGALFVFQPVDLH